VSRLDPAERQDLINIGIDGKIRSNPDGIDVVDDRLSLTDVIQIKRNSDLDVRLGDIEMIVKDADGAVRFLDTEKLDRAVSRHVDANNVFDTTRDTTIFPAGQRASVTTNGKTYTVEAPSRMPSKGAGLRDQIKVLAYETVRNGREGGGSYTYRLTDERYGIREMQVNTADGGRTTSIYPTEGPSLRRWSLDNNRWEKWVAEDTWEAVSRTNSIRSPTHVGATAL
jgi:hypothetical protein